MEKKLTFGSGFAESFAIMGKYFFKLLVNGFLFIIVLIVPYINLGALAGMYFLSIKMAKGEEIGWAEVLKKEYRSKIGDVCLSIGSSFIVAGIFFSALFLMVPFFFVMLEQPGHISDELFGWGIGMIIWMYAMLITVLSVLATGWSLSYAYFLDKKEYLFESYRRSFEATRGYKGTIFGISLVAVLVCFIVYMILFFIDVSVATVIGGLIYIVLLLFSRAMMACFYRRLALGDAPRVPPAAIPESSAALPPFPSTPVSPENADPAADSARQ